jgi:superfamily I DNA/RNA helicase
LTHTNVAIDELKLKTGGRVDRIFSYPNFFGTFQRFTNKFLGIPAYVHYYQKRPVSIGIEYFEKKLLYEYSQNYYLDGTFNPFAKWRYAINEGKTDDQKLSSADLKVEGCQKVLFIRIDYINEKLSDSIISEGAEKIPPFSFTSDSGEYIYGLKQKILDEGHLHYDDMYSLAFRYMQDFGESLKKALSSRFRYVFVDEMQDTYSHQNDILHQAFDDSVTVQKFGDPHQAIYNIVAVENVWVPSQSALPISTSKRFGKNIASVLQSVCIESNTDLSGNEEVDSFSPHIIVYDEDSTPLVLKRFVELVKGFGIDRILKETNRPIKAIGWVGPKPEKPEKHTVKAYFETYNRTANQQKTILKSVKSHLRKYKSNKAKDYYESIINCFLRILSMDRKKRETEKGSRSYTKNTLLSTLKEKNEEFCIKFRNKISKWIFEIINSEDDYSAEVLASIRGYIHEEFLPFFDIESDGDLNQFINSNLVDEHYDEEELSTKNIFKHPNKEFSDIEVNVGTIHSAKGETHTATLYLETDYHSKRESDRIMDQLKGNVYDNPNEEIRIKETLKMAYVGMSRPSHLLCFAGRKENIIPNRAELEANGWEIIDDLIN